MAVEKHLERKVIIVTYDTSLVKGHLVSCQFGRPGGEVIEKKNTPNRGSANFSVGTDFKGLVACRFVGSSGGEDSGEVVV